MPPKSLKLIKKGLNPPVQDNKTFNSLFKEALNSPEHFLCNNLSNFKLPSDIDFFIGFIETKQFETWLDIISRQNNWTRNKGLCHLLPTTIMNKYLATQKAGLFGRIILQLLSAGKI